MFVNHIPALEVTPAAEDELRESVDRRASTTVWLTGAATPGT